MILLLSDHSLITVPLPVTISISRALMDIHLLREQNLMVALYILVGGRCPRLKTAVLIQMRLTQKAAVTTMPGTHRGERFILRVSFPIVAAPCVLLIHHLMAMRSPARKFGAVRLQPTIPR